MKKLIAANWKMNKTVKESVEFIADFSRLLGKMKSNSEIVICAPFTSLYAVARELKKTSIKLGAQDAHFEPYGAFTGEISAAMLKDVGCEYVILGHSERREIFSENDGSINKKVAAALSQSLKPILCVGENLKQRDGGKAEEVIKGQLETCLQNIGKNQLLKMSIAYEPIWAISKGDPNKKAASSQDAEDMHEFIRSSISNLYGEETAKRVRIIYGGSMKPENAKELLAMPNIDGGLVGNASLNAESFAEIIMHANA